jgi:hypothetical protein
MIRSRPSNHPEATGSAIDSSLPGGNDRAGAVVNSLAVVDVPIAQMYPIRRRFQQIDDFLLIPRSSTSMCGSRPNRGYSKPHSEKRRLHYGRLPRPLQRPASRRFTSIPNFWDSVPPVRAEDVAVARRVRARPAATLFGPLVCPRCRRPQALRCVTALVAAARSGRRTDGRRVPLASRRPSFRTSTSGGLARCRRRGGGAARSPW